MSVFIGMLQGLYHRPADNLAEAILLRFGAVTGLVATCTVIFILSFGGYGLFTVLNETITTMTESTLELVLAVIFYAGMTVFPLYVLGLTALKLWKDFFDEDDFSKE
ncbi:MAG: hypothetical protein ACJKSS_03095 [Patescibacteria group bacterium UBA2103]